MKFRLISISVICVCSSLLLAACSSGEESMQNTSGNEQGKVVVAFYPLEFATKQIAGDDFEVINVTPVGAEAHDLELSPSATEEILEANLAIVLGEGFQPAVEKTAESRDGATLEVLHELEKLEDSEASGVSFKSHGGDDEKKEGTVDPHVWLDPIKMVSVVNLIRDELVELNPSSRSTYEKNASNLVSKMTDLDQDFKSGFSSCELKTFVTGHDAFSQLANRYGLTQESISGLSPEAEPSADRIDEILEIVKERKVEVVFVEERASTKVADTLSKDAGVKTQILSPLESLTQRQIEKGDDYFSIMKENLDKLSSALKCVA